MSANNLSEIAVNLIINALKANLPSALDEVRGSRADNLVTTEPPREYFTYQGAQVLRPPGVFVLVASGESQLNRGANYITALLRTHVNVVVEDRDMTRLVAKAYRYQAAINKVLHETQLTSADNSLKIVIKVSRFEYSTEYSTAQKASDTGGVFRKEVWLECEVENYESF